MSRETNMLSLINRIINEIPIKTTFTDFGTSSRITYQLNIAPLLNLSLFLFRSWEAFTRGDKEKEKFDISDKSEKKDVKNQVKDINTYVEWLRAELSGYVSVKDKNVRSLADYRSINGGFVNYDIGVLQLALNQGDSLEYMGNKKGLTKGMIYEILNSVYKKMLDKAIEIGKELDPKISEDGMLDRFERSYDLEGGIGSADDVYEDFGYSNEIMEE